ncbi:MAG: DUF1194 domain-containing protein [Brevirhabdus sp.]
MTRRLRWWLFVGLALVLGATGARAQMSCRQALALGLDVSGSVNAQEYRQQLDGLAGALADPAVQNALLAMPGIPVRLYVYEWSGAAYRRPVLPWTTITDDATLQRAIARLRGTARNTSPATTALGAAMEYGAWALSRQTDCWKRTLDISGDGRSNEGPRPRNIRNSGAMAGLTVNALAIGADDPNTGDNRAAEIAALASYFEAEVIFGENAFVETALGFADYQNAMTRKLLRELSVFAIGQLQ